MPNSAFSFPKTARLLRHSQFREIAKNGKQQTGKYIVLHFLEGSSYLSIKTVKLGITVSKKFGKAHIRNRFKRIVKEAFRFTLPEIEHPILINIRPREQAHRASMQDIQNELRELLKNSFQQCN